MNYHEIRALCDQADKIDPRAYAAACEHFQSDEEFIRMMKSIVQNATAEQEFGVFPGMA